MVIWINIFQTEIKVKICYNGLNRAAGNIFLMKKDKTSLKVHKSDVDLPF